MGFRRRADRDSEPLTRTAWHYGFAILVTERAPPGFEVRLEVLLSLHPRRIDQILLRRKDVRRRDDDGRVMRGLWPYLGDETILDFKGPTRGFCQGDLATLVSYGYQYYAANTARIGDPSQLGLVLVVPTLTATLTRQIARLRLTIEPLERGYARLTGGVYTTHVVFLDEAAVAERDDLLHIFTRARAVATPDAIRWMRTWVVERISMREFHKLEDSDEVLAKFLRSLDPEQRLAGLDPEQRLAGLEPEQRLAGLDPEQRLAGLTPDEIVDCLRSLPGDVRDRIRKEIDGRGARPSRPRAARKSRRRAPK